MSSNYYRNSIPPSTSALLAYYQPNKEDNKTNSIRYFGSDLDLKPVYALPIYLTCLFHYTTCLLCFIWN